MTTADPLVAAFLGPDFGPLYVELGPDLDLRYVELGPPHHGALGADFAPQSRQALAAKIHQGRHRPLIDDRLLRVGQKDQRYETLLLIRPPTAVLEFAPVEPHVAEPMKPHRQPSGR